MLNYVIPNVYLPRPQRLYPWLRSYHGRPSIDTAKVGEVLTEYGLALISRPKPASGGFRNKSLLVNTVRGKGILKRYQESLGQSTIIQEHSILEYLAQIGFPATRLVSTKAGQTLVQRGKKRYVLFDFVEGGFRSYDYISLPKQTRQYIAIAGEMLAILHEKLRDFVPQGYNPDGFKSKTGDRWRNDEWFINKLTFCVEKTLQRNKNNRKHKSSSLIQRARDLENILVHNTSMLNSADLPRQIIHKDYGPSNLLFRKNAPPVVLDFEIARLDWRIVDIISAWQGFCETRSGYSLNKMKIFLDSYQTHMPLISAEIELIPAVWEFLEIRGCINYWHNYCSTGDKVSLDRACQSFNKLEWVTANQYEIMKRDL
jgi:homoserine kinase type II